MWRLLRDAVRSKAVDFFKLPINAALVLVDEVALDFGKLRLKEKGSPGGHNGLKSIQAHLKTQDYNRLRIGIGGKDSQNTRKKAYILVETRTYCWYRFTPSTRLYYKGVL